MLDLSPSSLRFSLLLTLRRLAASTAVSKDNPDRLGNDDADTIAKAAEALTLAMLTLRSMPGGLELAIIILRAAEDLAARAPLDEIRDRVYAKPALRKQASAAGKVSATNRALEADETWRAEVLRLASAKRQSNPYVSKESLATAIVGDWRLRIKKPAWRTVLDYLFTLEKGGQLRIKEKKRPVK